MLGKDVLKRKGVHTRKIPIFLNFFIGMNLIMSTLQKKTSYSRCIVSFFLSLLTPVALSLSSYLSLLIMATLRENLPYSHCIVPLFLSLLSPVALPPLLRREIKRMGQCNGVEKFLSYTTHFFKTSSQFVVLGCKGYLNL